MKKLLALMLMLALLLSALPAGAAGRLNVEQENFYAIDDYSLYLYTFAKVSNVGDKPIMVNTSLMEVFDAEGDPITSRDYFSAYARYLQPGEYTYIKLYENLQDRKAEEVDDYMLTVTGKADNNYSNLRLPVSDLAYEPNVAAGWTTYNYMYVTLTNDTEETLFDIEVVLSLLDAEGNILFVDSDSMYSDKGLTPGSSITIRKNVDANFIKYYEENGITPASVDAIAFVEVSQ